MNFAIRIKGNFAGAHYSSIFEKSYLSMDFIDIKPTENSPGIVLDKSTGLIQFEGRSFPENAVVFFRPVLDWMNRYCENPAANTTCNFRLEYFNSSSQKFIVDVLKMLSDLSKNGHSIAANWYYKSNDDEMKEVGEEFQSMLRIKFVIKEY